MNPGPGGGVKFFKFIANFQIGIGHQILGGCLNFRKNNFLKLVLNTNFPFFLTNTFMIHKVALPWQNTQNLTSFINLILLYGALLFSFEAGSQPFNRINTHIINMCNRSDVSLSYTCINIYF